MATKPTSVLITDRTQLNVINKTPKGFINLLDIQRVQDWINYFIDEINPSLPKYTWFASERVDLTKWQIYIINNVTELLKFYPDLSLTVPTAEHWDWKKQNELESILLSMSNSEPLLSKSFSDDDWNTIIKVAKYKKGSQYYKYGDTKTEILSNGKTAVYRVVAFDEFTIYDTKEKANITIEFEIQDETYQMDSDPSAERKRDWSTCEFRLITAPKIFSLLNEILQKNIKEVSVTYHPYGSGGSANYNTPIKEKLYPYSTEESVQIGKNPKEWFWRRDASHNSVYLYKFTFPYYRKGDSWREDFSNAYHPCKLLFNI